MKNMEHYQIIEARKRELSIQYRINSSQCIYDYFMRDSYDRLEQALR